MEDECFSLYIIEMYLVEAYSTYLNKCSHVYVTMLE